MIISHYRYNSLKHHTCQTQPPVCYLGALGGRRGGLPPSSLLLSSCLSPSLALVRPVPASRQADPVIRPMFQNFVRYSPSIRKYCTICLDVFLQNSPMLIPVHLSSPVRLMQWVSTLFLPVIRNIETHKYFGMKLSNIVRWNFRIF